MKKEYITPSIEVMNIETVEMMAASLAMYDEEVETTSQLGAGRRGEWGNRWAD